jgi:tetratricopeptide (TPR) repeat protein
VASAAASPRGGHAPEKSKVTEAQDAIAVGAYDRADALVAAAETAELQGLREAEALEREAIEAAERRRRGVAAARAQRGEIALIELGHLEAAGQFEVAAGLVPAGDYDLRGNYLGAQANALYQQGDRRGDNGSLGSAVATYRAALEERTRERVPLDWAMTQNNLGNALQALGERRSDLAVLDAARAALAAAWEMYRAAGQEAYDAYFEQQLAAIDRVIAARTIRSRTKR